MSIGANIKFFREKAGMNQEELAKQSTIAQGQISDYESCKVKPGLENLSKIAKALNVSGWQLDISFQAIQGVTEGIAHLLPRSDLKPVPVYTIAQAAQIYAKPFGDPIADQAVLKTCSFINPSEGDFAVIVSGSSMLPWYPPGTRLLIGRGKKPKTGDRVIANIAESVEPVFKIYIDLGSFFVLLSINEEEGTPPRKFDKMDKGETWFWCFPVKESIRDENNMDEAMKASGKRHAWQDWLDKYLTENV